jgi:hypothetical protein
LKKLRGTSKKLILSLLTGVLLTSSVVPAKSVLAEETITDTSTIDLTTQETVDKIYEKMKKQTSTFSVQSTSTLSLNTTQTFTKEEVANVLEAVNEQLAPVNSLNNYGQIVTNDSVVNFMTVELLDDGTRKYTNYSFNDSTSDSVSIELNNYYFPNSKVTVGSTKTSGFTTQATTATPQQTVIDAAITAIVELLLNNSIRISKPYIKAMLQTKFMKKGWIQWKVPYNPDFWSYKDNWKVVRSQWVYDKAQWYYIDSTGLMHDPYWHGEWRKINGRWYQFIPRELGGDGRIYKKEGWDYQYYKKTGKWIYFIPGNYGLATNESRVINGKRYYFDKNGFCTNP